MARDRRHPAEVTADRLANALERWPDAFDGVARDKVASIRTILLDIAESAESSGQAGG
ncbi:hypothetical protein [Nonomuraea sp. MG754425]|uniref:hypothetical protein n=1 Tax=Nonomuraea sp. MG754425 TaxID=2570319 RepID=UPI001F15E56A|nr:hypothetical protein [Nonomuraea sp. MG754425]